MFGQMLLHFERNHYTQLRIPYEVYGTLLTIRALTH
jgi:hypothetical protein